MLCVAPLAQYFDVLVEVMFLEDMIQSRVEPMRGGAWQVFRATDIDVCFARRRRLPIAIATL